MFIQGYERRSVAASEGEELHSTGGMDSVGVLARRRGSGEVRNGCRLPEMGVTSRLLQRQREQGQGSPFELLTRYQQRITEFTIPQFQNGDENDHISPILKTHVFVIPFQ
jgi:hypothetical protein